MALRLLVGGFSFRTFIPIMSILLIASALAVPVQLGDLDDGDMTLDSADWRTEIVDDTQCGYYTSLALDSRGHPHITYLYDLPTYDLRYARWTGVGWSISTVDREINPKYTSIEVDEEDNPHISYTSDTHKDLKYARWTGSAWKVETVDSYGWVGEHTSLALDSNDYPHISYFDGEISGLNYAAWTGSMWSIETVDAPGYVGRFTSLALDGNDHPHISYYDNFNRSLKYAKWNGSSWNIETVDGDGDVGWWTSIALDSDNHPHISYYDWANEDLKYAEWNGSAWSIETVDSWADVGMYPSIAIDSGDSPHISYRLMFPMNGELQHEIHNRVLHHYIHLRYAKRIGGNWSIETADSTGVGGYTSLALDVNDDPHIGYFSYGDYDAKYATKAQLEQMTPVLSYSPSTLDFGILPSGMTDMKTFDVWNSGNGTLAFNISESVPWATASPLEGWSTGEPHTISVTIETTGLPEGLHEGPIYIGSNGGNGTVILSVYVTAPERSITLDIDPDTLNLKSKGRWITAYLSAENASVHDMNVSTILLQDALVPERWDYQDDVLMLKFNRQEFKDTVQVGESVQIKLTGKWEDGTAFEAYDNIRVINPGK